MALRWQIAAAMKVEKESGGGGGGGGGGFGCYVRGVCFLDSKQL